MYTSDGESPNEGPKLLDPKRLESFSAKTRPRKSLTAPKREPRCTFCQLQKKDLPRSFKSKRGATKLTNN